MDVKCFITIINTKNRNGDGTEVLMTQGYIYANFSKIDQR